MQGKLKLTSHKYYYFCLFFILTNFSLKGQSKIYGNVIDDQDKPLEDVMVSINGSQYVSSNRAGSFEISLKNKSFSEIKAVKKGYKIKSWQEKPNGITIVLQPSTKLTGSVVQGSNYVPNAKVNVGNLNTYTDASGNFNIEIPASMTINEKTSFQVNGENIIPSNLTFKYNYGSVTIRLPAPKADIAKTEEAKVKDITLKGVIIYNAQRQPLANTIVKINGKHYKSDFLGKVSFQKPIKKHKVQQIIIEGRELFKRVVVGDFLVLNFVDEKELSSSEEIYASEMGNITNTLIEQGALQEERSKQLQADLEVLSNRLRTDNNLSPQQRQVLLAYAEKLEQTFVENDKSYQFLQKQSMDRINQMKSLIVEKDSIQSITEEKLEIIASEKEALEAEKELAALRSRTNMIILSLVAFGLLLVAVVFLVSNNRIRKQKRLLEEAKDELSQKVKQINAQNKEITEKNKNIEEKNLELQTTYSQIRSSVVSAQRIQSSILPNTKPLFNYFAEGFVFYLPRDIVSGDFYWYAQKGDDMIVAAIDCTGHGVPGAFMTMLGNSLLNQIVNEDGITNPAQILKILDEKVQATLHQKDAESTSSEGMDMVLLYFDSFTETVYFSGAKSPLFYIQNDELKMIKGSNVPIGNTRLKIKREFEEHKIPYEKGMTFYLASDGYQDQFGGTVVEGKRPKKFMKSKLKKLLLEIYQKPMNEQQEIMNAKFKDWKGEVEQTDDVIVMGLRM